MYCSEAEKILSQGGKSDAKVKAIHDSLSMDHSRKIPPSDDAFDVYTNPTQERLYWEEKLREEHSDSYGLYLTSRGLNAFVFYVGMKVFLVNAEVAAELGNYRALRVNFTEETAQNLEKYYPQAAQILVAKLQLEKLYRLFNEQKDYSNQLEKTLFALDRAVEYDSANYDVYLTYDSTLRLEPTEIVRDLIGKKIISEHNLEGRTLGYLWERREEQSSASTLVSAL